MRELDVSIEYRGSQRRVGRILGETPVDARFSYDGEYLASDDAVPLSLSLPLNIQTFSAASTRAFFEGLLPEGFTRTCVAQVLRVDEDDYLSVLSALGAECIGAVMISEVGVGSGIEPGYRRFGHDDIVAFSEEGVSEAARIVTETNLSLAGASGKIGLLRSPVDGTWFMPLGTAPSTHIVKQSHVRYRDLVVNEQLCLSVARACGLNAVTSFIEDAGKPLIAVERYDRRFCDKIDHPASDCAIDGRSVSGSSTINDLPVPRRLHQEDFAQALGIRSLSKYEPAGGHYFARMMELLRRVSSSPIQDEEALWDAVVFDCLIGNMDAHLKNFSLVYDDEWRTLRLAPLYDIVDTLRYEKTTRELSIAIGGEKRIERIGREQFEQAAKDAGLSPVLMMRRVDDMRERFGQSLDVQAQALAEQGHVEALRIRDDILAGNVLYRR